MESEFEYYRRRAAEEQHAAAHALSPEAETRHLELAARYSGLAEHWLDSAAQSEAAE